MNIQIPDYKKVKVLVVGDVMLDLYWLGQATKISPEAPVPVINHQSVEKRAGGAANVAMNLAELGVEVELIGVLGDDENAESLQALLDEKGVKTQFCYSDGPTITKTRVVSQHQQLIRIDQEKLPQTSPQLSSLFKSRMDSYEYIIFSDYQKGALVDVASLIQCAKLAGKKILVDPKGNDFERYRGAYLLTPNKAEFRQIVGSIDHNDELEQKASELIHHLDLDAFLLTRSEEGVSLFEKKGDTVNHEHFEAKAKEVFDVTGAGDTVISVLAASLATGCSLAESVELANLAASVVIGKLGTATVNAKELEQAIYEQRIIKQGFVSESVLLEELKQARLRGERIVMTNGCFDILHTGHVNYLQEASKLGDRLIVAINTDESVRRLKGDGRPANRLESRAHVLAALRAVDWVVAFTEDTPVDIITKCDPDFLVKGGDNNPDKIPGAKEVKAAGGEVLVMNYIEGFSTTKTISRIKEQVGYES